MVYTREFVETVRSHRADVHQIDYIQGGQFLPGAKLQPKIRVVVYESKADYSRKHHGTTLAWNTEKTQETVYELSRLQRNEASFEAKAKETVYGLSGSQGNEASFEAKAKRTTTN